MKFFICSVLLSVLFFSLPAEALEGKALYDYMCLFINTYINDPHYEKTIESIYSSTDWITLDAQYGPFNRPTPSPVTVPPQKK